MISDKSPHIRLQLLLLLCYILILSHPLYAYQSFTGEDSTYRSKYLVLPAIATSPETSLMLGGVLIRQFKPKNAGSETRSSTMLVSAIYTLKNQILCSFLPDIILPNESWILTGNYYINYFPDKFWGVGPNTKNSDEISVIFTQINLEQSFLKQIKPTLYIGPQIRWSRLSGVKFKDTEGNRINAPDINGAKGSTSAGLGFIARWDKRNSILTPTKDYYLNLSLLFNPAFLGTSNPYNSFQLDARRYFDLRKNGHTVIALQTITRFISGSPPFRDMAVIGGDKIMRGYYEGRYRDNNASQIQAEFRQQIAGRFGFTIFSGFGNVWNNFRDFSVSNTKWASGIGLRFDMNPRDTNNLRLDFGIGQHTTGFYLMFGEAF